MSYWAMFLMGFAAAGPIWVLLSLWISRRIWHTARRVAARSRGQQQLAELGHLAGGLAHEIKNPLSTINVNLQLLAEDLARHEDELHCRWLRRLTAVREETDRVKGILDDFLQYARHYELDLQTLDLRKLVQELVDFFAPQAEANHVLLRADTMPSESIRCRLDKDLIKQAILNLLLNAVQAMPGGGELIVRLSVRRGRAILEVIDTGKGMTSEERSKIFEVYYSTKPGGSGLGLPTTLRIIREHQGSISVESEPGKGTRFLISLPLTKQP